MNKKLISNNKAITLIALIITIIILLILAGVTISTLTESGLFEKAKIAKQEAENAQAKENAIINEYVDLIVKESNRNNYSQGCSNSSFINFWGINICLPFDGEGSNINPYKIDEGGELAFLSMMVNFGESFEGKYFELSKDINLNQNKYTINSETGEITFAGDARQWTAIGNEENTFKGIFDGKGHIIKGIYISNSKNYQGLFGTNDGTIRNLCIAESYIEGNTYVAGICGKNNTNGIIEKCYSNMTIKGKDGFCGGISGSNEGIIQQCYNMSKVESVAAYSGGICGYNSNIIRYCYNLGDIKTGRNSSSNAYAGGICGNNIADISYTYNMGKITKTSGTSYLGGIVGLSQEGNLFDSYSSTMTKVIGRNYPKAGTTTNSEIKTESDMKTEAFIELIGGSEYWKIDSKTGNVILKWQ